MRKLHIKNEYELERALKNYFSDSSEDIAIKVENKRFYIYVNADINGYRVKCRKERKYITYEHSVERHISELCGF